MDRRSFLRGLVGAGAGVAFGGGFLHRAMADVATGGTSPWGPLQAEPDGNGLLVPAGFESRVVGTGLQPVPGTGYPWHMFPDGAATYATDDGGWILVSNSEVPLLPPTGVTGLPWIGGAGAIRFDRDGTIVDAYPVLTGTKVNCAGGVTPWGTWLSCEEWDGGFVWECHPEGLTAGLPRRLDAMGAFAHEAAAFDDSGLVYLTEDEGDGLFYRFLPEGPGSEGLASGVLEAMQVTDLDAVLAGGASGVTWHAVPDPTPLALDYQDDWLGRTPLPYPDPPVRTQVGGATPFAGGEGCWHHEGFVYFTTKGDDRVWRLDVAAQSLDLIHDPALDPSTTLDGVDNLIVHSETDHIYVAEDGGNMEVQVLVPDGLGGFTVAPVVRMVGDGHGLPEEAHGILPSPTDVAESSEVTGLAFDPSGTRLYCSSQRYNGFGITYEITGPFASA